MEQIVTAGETPIQVWVAETAARVPLPNRALNLAGEVLDLTVEPLRRIAEGSGATVEEDSSESKEDFEECRDVL